MSTNVQQPEGLIQVLLDVNAEYGDRDDAAMDLSAYDDRAAEEALASIACDPTADEDLADTCGESLAVIWSRRNSIDEKILMKLCPVGRWIAIGTLEALSPELATQAERMLRGST